MGIFLFKSSFFNAVTKKLSKGGLVEGKSHDNGGVKGVNVTTGEPIEVEGGEVIITKKAVKSKKKRSYKGTNKQILSKINESGGGVPIYKAGGEVIGSAPTKDALEKSINDYYYSTSYRIEGNDLYNDKGLYKKDSIRQKKGRWQFIRVSKMKKGGSIPNNYEVLKISVKRTGFAKGGSTDKTVEIWLNGSKVYQGDYKGSEDYLKKYKKFKEASIMERYGLKGQKMYGAKNEYGDYPVNRKLEKIDNWRDFIPVDKFEFKNNAGEFKSKVIVEPKELAKERTENIKKDAPKSKAPRKKPVKKRATKKHKVTHRKTKKHPDVKVAFGRRLVHGNTTVKAKKDKYYRKGGKTK